MAGGIDITVLPMRFIEKVKFNCPGGCWKWTGYVGSDGYGKYRLGRTMVRAHRFSYAAFVGPIPDHLRAVTNKQNSEHLSGAQRNNRGSGFRNVYRNGIGYQVKIVHNRKVVQGGYFLDIEEAVIAAAALRARYFTHADGDAS